jgi:Clp amino terminal domain, pathogenicity island component
VGSADPLLMAILGQWDDERAGGPALLRACGVSAGQASRLAATLLPTEPADAARPEAEPRIIGTLRFVLDRAYRSRPRPAPLEEAEVPTPAVAMLGELARQQAGQHPVEGDGRLSTLHHLLALLMVPGSAAGRLLRELGVGYEEVVRYLEAEGARRVAGDDWRPEEHPLEGWAAFRVTDRQHEVARGRFHEVNKDLWPRGVRFMFGKDLDDSEWPLVWIHPGDSGLDPREVLDRLLGHGS